MNDLALLVLGEQATRESGLVVAADDDQVCVEVPCERSHLPDRVSLQDYHLAVQTGFPDVLRQHAELLPRSFPLHSERRNDFLADAETIARFQRANVNQVN